MANQTIFGKIAEKLKAGGFSGSPLPGAEQIVPRGTIATEDRKRVPKRKKKAGK